MLVTNSWLANTKEADIVGALELSEPDNSSQGFG